MARKALQKDWYIELAKGHDDLSRIQPAGRKTLVSPPFEPATIPPFRGISRELLTKKEASEKLGVSTTFIDKQIRSRMIFPQPRGRLIYIPIEEVENYIRREQERYMELHA